LDIWEKIRPLYTTLIKPALHDAGNFFIDTFFPVSCILCGKESLFICAECQTTLQKAPFEQCIHCKKPSVLGATHPGCKSPYGADGLISFFDYRDKKVSKIIISGKYKSLPGAFAEFSHIIANKMKTPGFSSASWLTNFTLVPIPLSPSRQRWRGFNQSEIICATLSEHLNLPMLHALQRQKNTKTQKDLKRDERIKNVANAFVLSEKIYNLKSLPGRQTGSILNQNFVLIDDVTTTGSTLLEAVKVLKRNGANKVWCLTIARD